MCRIVLYAWNKQVKSKNKSAGSCRHALAECVDRYFQLFKQTCIYVPQAIDSSWRDRYMASGGAFLAGNRCLVRYERPTQAWRMHKRDA